MENNIQIIHSIVYAIEEGNFRISFYHGRDIPNTDFEVGNSHLCIDFGSTSVQNICFERHVLSVASFMLHFRGHFVLVKTPEKKFKIHGFKHPNMCFVIGYYEEIHHVAFSLRSKAPCKPNDRILA